MLCVDQIEYVYEGRTFTTFGFCVAIVILIIVIVVIFVVAVL